MLWLQFIMFVNIHFSQVVRILLVLSGVEQNPGPVTQTTVDIVKTWFGDNLRVNRLKLRRKLFGQPFCALSNAVRTGLGRLPIVHDRLGITFQMDSVTGELSVISKSAVVHICSDNILDNSDLIINLVDDDVAVKLQELISSSEEEQQTTLSQLSSSSLMTASSVIEVKKSDIKDYFDVPMSEELDFSWITQPHVSTQSSSIGIPPIAIKQEEAEVVLENQAWVYTDSASVEKKLSESNVFKSGTSILSCIKEFLISHNIDGTISNGRLDSLDTRQTLGSRKLKNFVRRQALPISANAIIDDSSDSRILAALRQFKESSFYNRPDEDSITDDSTLFNIQLDDCDLIVLWVLSGLYSDFAYNTFSAHEYLEEDLVKLLFTILATRGATESIFATEFDIVQNEFSVEILELCSQIYLKTWIRGESIALEIINQINIGSSLSITESMEQVNGLIYFNTVLRMITNDNAEKGKIEGYLSCSDMEELNDLIKLRSGALDIGELRQVLDVIHLVSANLTESVKDLGESGLIRELRSLDEAISKSAVRGKATLRSFGKKNETIYSEVKSVTRRVRDLVPYSAIRKISKFCISKGFCPPASISGIINGLHTTSSILMQGAGKLSDEEKSLLRLIQRRCEESLSLLQDFHHKIASQTDKIIRLLQLDNAALSTRVDLESGLSIKDVQRKSVIFNRVKGELNEVMMRRVLGLEDDTIGQTLRQLINFYFPHVEVGYCPTLVKEELNNLPDGSCLISKDDLLRMFPQLSLSQTISGFDQGCLDNYNRELSKPVENVIVLSSENHFQELHELQKTINLKSPMADTLVIFEFGHTSRNTTAKVQHDVSKYSSIRLISNHIVNVVLIVITTSTSGYTNLKMLNNELSILIDSMQLCSTALSMCYIDASSMNPDLTDSSKHQHSSSRLPFPEMSEEYLSEVLGSVTTSTDEHLSKPIFPPKVISTLFNYLRGRSNFQYISQEVTKEEIFRQVLQKFESNPLNFHLPQFAPLKFNREKTSSELLMEFSEGLVVEQQSWSSECTDTTALNAIYNKSKWKVLKSDPAYCVKVDNADYKAMLKLNDSLSSSPSIRIRSILNNATSKGSHTDILSAQDMAGVSKACSAYAGGKVYHQLAKVEKNEEIELLRGLIAGTHYCKLNMLSADTPEERKVRMTSKVAQQDLRNQKVKDSCLYQIICHFTPEDGSFIKLGRSSVIKKFSTRDPELLRSTFTSLGLKEPTKRDIEKLEQDSILAIGQTVLSRLSAKAKKVAIRLESLNIFYSNQIEVSFNVSKIAATLLDKARALNCVGLPITLNKSLELVVDDKTNPYIDWKLCCLVIYHLLSEARSKQSLMSLFVDDHFKEVFKTQMSPQEISISKLKSIAKRQVHFNGPVLIKKFERSVLLQIPMSKDGLLNEVIESFWKTIGTQRKFVCPEYLTEEMQSLMTSLKLFCDLTSIIDDLILISQVASEVISLTGAKSYSRSTYQSLKLTENIDLIINVPKMNSTLFRVSLCLSTGDQEVYTNTINIDELDLIPLINGPYYFMFYLSNMLNEHFPDLVKALGSGNILGSQSEVNGMVAGAMARVQYMVRDCFNPYSDLETTGQKTMEFLDSVRQESQITRFFFHAFFIRMVSIPAVICNDKPHNTSMQNLRYVYMSILSDQFDMKGIAKKMVHFSRKVECQLHMASIVSFCSAAILRNEMGSSIQEKKKKFSQDIFIDPITAVYCTSEAQFVNSFYEMHGYVRGLLSDQSNANVHNAFFEIPLKLSKKVGSILCQLEKCSRRCVQMEDRIPFVDRSLLCFSCKKNMDDYVRTTQIPMYDFDSKSDVLSFISSSIDIAMNQAISVTHGCPYMQIIAGNIAYESYTTQDKSECEEAFDLKGLSRTELLQSTSIISSFDLSFDPVKAQSKSAEVLYTKITGSHHASFSEINDELADQVNKALEEYGIDFSEIIKEVKSGISSTVVLTKDGTTKSSRQSQISLSDLLLQPELSTSVLKLIGNWVVWSKDRTSTEPLEDVEIEQLRDTLSTLSSMSAKIAVTGESSPLENLGSEKKETEEGYSELLKSKELKGRFGMTGKKLQQMKKRLIRQANSVISSEYNKSKFKADMAQIGNKLLTSVGDLSDDMSAHAIDERVDCINNILEVMMAEDDEIEEVLQNVIPASLINKIALYTTKDCILPKELVRSVKDPSFATLSLGEIGLFDPPEDFKRMCKEVVNLIEQVQELSGKELNGIQKEAIRVKLSALDDLGYKLKTEHSDSIIKVVSHSVEEMTRFPISLLFPSEAKYVTSGKTYHEFAKKFFLKATSEMAVASGILVCFGDEIGKVILKTMKLSFSDVEQSGNLILLTTPIIHDQELFNPCLPLFDACVGLSRKTLDVMRFVKNGTAIPRKYAPFRLKSNRVSFEIASDITKSATSLLWDSVAFHLSEPSWFVQKIAAKAQFGAERDLVVQDLPTKECMALLERVSKKFLGRSRHDILVHPERKIAVIKDISKSIGDKLSNDAGQLAVFSSDETKWGPTHNALAFLNILLPVMKGNEDYVNLLQTCCVKNAGKVVIVQPKLIFTVISFLTSKSIKIMRHRDGCYVLVNKMGHQLDKDEYLSILSGLSPGAVDVLEQCILKGKTYIRVFSHMGQGIFHATSSLAADCFVRFQVELRRYIQENQIVVKGVKINQSLEYNTLRSSDDSITVVKCDGENDTLFEKSVLNLYFLDTLLFHLMNTRKSGKHVGSVVAIIGEVYSTFTSNRTIQPKIKQLMAILTASPGSTLLSTALTRYNLARGCIETGSTLMEVILTCTLAYSRDVTSHPKTSSTAVCGREFPMCLSSQPDLSFSSLMSDPFTSELNQLLKSIRLAIGKYFARCLESESVLPPEIEEKVIVGDYSHEVVEFVDKDGPSFDDVDIDMCDAMYCMLEPGEIYEGLIKTRRAMRTKDSGIYSEIQLVPQSRMVAEKFKEIKSTLTGDLTADMKADYQILELASSHKQPRSFEIAVTKAAQSVRNQDPNAQRSLNPVNAMNQSLHSIRGFYCKVPKFVNCPRAKLTSGFSLTTLSKFSKWSISTKEFFNGQNIATLMRKLEFFRSLEKLQGELNPNLRRIEMMSRIKGKKNFDEIQYSWRTLGRTIKVTPTPTPFNEVACFIIDPILMNKHGLQPDHQSFIQSVEIIAEMDYNLIALPIVGRIIYKRAVDDPNSSSSEYNSPEVVRKEVDIFKSTIFKNFDESSLIHAIHRIVRMIESEKLNDNISNLAYSLSIVKHWSDMLSSSQKKLNPIYMECTSGMSVSEEVDLVKLNSSQVFEYRISQDFKGVRSAPARLEIVSKEAAFRSLISVASCMEAKLTSVMANQIIKEGRKLVQSEGNRDIISNEILSLTNHGRLKDSGFQSHSVNVVVIFRQGVKGYLFRDARSKKAVLLCTTLTKPMKSFLAADDPSVIERGLNDIHAYITGTKDRFGFREIIKSLPVHSFIAGFSSDKKPILMSEQGNITVISANITKPITAPYATIHTIGESREEDPVFYRTREDEFRFQRNVLVCDSINKVSSLSEPTQPYMTLGGIAYNQEILKTSRRVYGSESHTRESIRVAHAKLDYPDVKESSYSTFNHLREQGGDLGSADQIVRFISEHVDNLVKLTSESGQLKIKDGPKVVKTRSSLFNIVRCIFLIHRPVVNYDDISYELMIDRIGREKCRTLMTEVFQSEASVISSITEMRKKVQCDQNRDPCLSSCPTEFTINSGRPCMFIKKENLSDVLSQFKFTPDEDDLSKKTAKAISKFKLKGNVGAIIRAFKKIVKQRVTYSPFEFKHVKSSLRSDLEGLRIESKEWKSDIPLLFYTGIHRIHLMSRFDLMDSLFQCLNIVGSVGTGKLNLPYNMQEERSNVAAVLDPDEVLALEVVSSPTKSSTSTKGMSAAEKLILKRDLSIDSSISSEGSDDDQELFEDDYFVSDFL